ncbi:DUF86 domain-containing protein [Candidatus Saganbacteria bacterium]|nr:DUF86 domain-containing protein [Candidatus Saganbacteria bacterium]
MAEFSYAKGRVGDSLHFIANEMKEYENDYGARTWEEYQKDIKLQKLVDRTVENVLTALIEVCGTLLAEKGISAENYSEVLSKAADLFGFDLESQKNLAKLAVQRNRLAHRYLDLKWQAVKAFSEQKGLILRLIEKILNAQSLT